MLKIQNEIQENIRSKSRSTESNTERIVYTTTGNLENIESELPENLSSLDVLQARIGELDKEISDYEKRNNDVREKVNGLKEKTSELKVRIEQGKSYLIESEQDLANRKKQLFSDIQKAGFERIEEITQSLFVVGKKAEIPKKAGRLAQRKYTFTHRIGSFEKDY